MSVQDLRRFIADYHDRVLAAIALAAIVAGLALHLVGEAAVGDAVFAASVAILLVPLTFDVLRTLVVERRLGVDIIALVAMAASTRSW